MASDDPSLEYFLPYVRGESPYLDFDSITNPFWRAIVYLIGVPHLEGAHHHHRGATSGSTVNVEGPGLTAPITPDVSKGIEELQSCITLGLAQVYQDNEYLQGYVQERAHLLSQDQRNMEPSIPSELKWIFQKFFQQLFTTPLPVGDCLFVMDSLRQLGHVPSSDDGRSLTISRRRIPHHGHALSRELGSRLASTAMATHITKPAYGKMHLRTKENIGSLLVDVIARNSNLKIGKNNENLEDLWWPSGSVIQILHKKWSGDKREDEVKIEETPTFAVKSSGTVETTTALLDIEETTPRTQETPATQALAGEIPSTETKTVTITINLQNAAGQAAGQAAEQATETAAFVETEQPEFRQGVEKGGQFQQGGSSSSLPKSFTNPFALSDTLRLENCYAGIEQFSNVAAESVAHEINQVPQPVATDFFLNRKKMELLESEAAWHLAGQGANEGLNAKAATVFYGDKRLTTRVINWDQVMSNGILFLFFYYFLVISALYYYFMIKKRRRIENERMQRRTQERLRKMEEERACKEKEEKRLSELSAKTSENPNEGMSSSSGVNLFGETSSTEASKEKGRKARSSDEEKDSEDESKHTSLRDHQTKRQKEQAQDQHQSQQDQEDKDDNYLTALRQEFDTFFKILNMSILCIFVCILYVSISYDETAVQTDKDYAQQLWEQSAAQGSWQSSFSIALIALEQSPTGEPDLKRGSFYIEETKRLILENSPGHNLSKNPDLNAHALFSMSQYYSYRHGFFLSEEAKLRGAREVKSSEEKLAGDPTKKSELPLDLSHYVNPNYVNLAEAGKNLKIAADLQYANAVHMLSEEYLQPEIYNFDRESGKWNKAPKLVPHDVFAGLAYLELAAELHGRVAAKFNIGVVLLQHIIGKIAQIDEVELLRELKEKREELIVNATPESLKTESSKDLKDLSLLPKELKLKLREFYSCEALKHFFAVVHDMSPTQRLIQAISMRTFELAGLMPNSHDKKPEFLMGAVRGFSIVGETGNKMGSENAGKILLANSLIAKGIGMSEEEVQMEARKEAKEERNKIHQPDVILPHNSGYYCCPSGDCENPGWTYNDGGYTFLKCLQVCNQHFLCNFLTFYESGYCQLSESCDAKRVAGDPSAKTFEIVGGKRSQPRLQHGLDGSTSLKDRIKAEDNERSKNKMGKGTDGDDDDYNSTQWSFSTELVSLDLNPSLILGNSVARSGNPELVSKIFDKDERQKDLAYLYWCYGVEHEREEEHVVEEMVERKERPEQEGDSERSIPKKELNFFTLLTALMRDLGFTNLAKLFGQDLHTGDDSESITTRQEKGGGNEGNKTLKNDDDEDLVKNKILPPMPEIKKTIKKVKNIQAITECALSKSKKLVTYTGIVKRADLLSAVKDLHKLFSDSESFSEPWFVSVSALAMLLGEFVKSVLGSCSVNSNWQDLTSKGDAAGVTRALKTLNLKHLKLLECETDTVLESWGFDLKLKATKDSKEKANLVESLRDSVSIGVNAFLLILVLIQLCIVLCITNHFVRRG